MRLVLDSSTMFYGETGETYAKTQGKEGRRERRGDQEVQRTDSMSSRSDSLNFVINIWSSFASMMSCIYSNLHSSSRGIGWYLIWNASSGQISLTSVLLVFKSRFRKYEPLVDLVSNWIASNRNFDADLSDFRICSRKDRNRFKRIVFKCVTLLSGSIILSFFFHK